MEAAEFIQRWRKSGGAEIANSQSFLKELCDLIGVPHPEPTVSDEEILERLVALNHERAAEEARGLIRWLRPDFQNPDKQVETQTSLAIIDDVGEDEEKSKPKRKGKAGTKSNDKPLVATKKLEWPKSLPDRIRAVRGELEALRSPVTVDDIASRFVRAPKANDLRFCLFMVLYPA